MMEIVALKMGLTSRNMQRRRRGFKGVSNPSVKCSRNNKSNHFNILRSKIFVKYLEDKGKEGKV